MQFASHILKTLSQEREKRKRGALDLFCHKRKGDKKSLANHSFERNANTVVKFGQWVASF